LEIDVIQLTGGLRGQLTIGVAPVEIAMIPFTVEVV